MVEAARRVRFVTASTDLIHVPHRGQVWTADTAVPLADAAELSFTVDDDLQLHFYERIMRPPTWSEFVRRQAQERAPEDRGAAGAGVDEVTEAEEERRRARDLERRLRALGFHCPPGTLEPLTQDEQFARSPAAVDRAAAGEPVMTGVIRRVFETPITVR